MPRNVLSAKPLLATSLNFLLFKTEPRSETTLGLETQHSELQQVKLPSGRPNCNTRPRYEVKAALTPTAGFGGGFFGVVFPLLSADGCVLNDVIPLRGRRTHCVWLWPSAVKPLVVGGWPRSTWESFSGASWRMPYRQYRAHHVLTHFSPSPSSTAFLFTHAVTCYKDMDEIKKKRLLFQMNWIITATLTVLCLFLMLIKGAFAWYHLWSAGHWYANCAYVVK